MIYLLGIRDKKKEVTMKYYLTCFLSSIVTTKFKIFPSRISRYFAFSYAESGLNKDFILLENIFLRGNVGALMRPATSNC